MNVFSKPVLRTKLKYGEVRRRLGGVSLKVVVAGSRSIYDYEKVRRAIEESGFEIDEIVSGTAKGVDKLGEAYAKENDIPVKRFPADWSKHGKKAGAIRNEEMAEYADALVAVWDGDSSGTKIMIDKAEKHDLKVFVKKL